ncbi:cysteine alpha-hairpin motif superfamily [Lipomyces oligophaga]|uniref:cysteine alpha-hairpin motif superfamily n=1 Tax=Lipomyces oligophaga TaxID=45792 RepID=UPI0034CFFABA
MAFDLSQEVSQNMPKDVKVSEVQQTSKPKPCCVCLDEKTARDECMLVSEDGRKQCADLISSYKSCMKEYGFNV